MSMPLSSQTGAVLYQPDLERTGPSRETRYFNPLDSTRKTFKQSRAELSHLRQGTSGYCARTKELASFICGTQTHPVMVITDHAKPPVLPGASEDWPSRKRIHCGVGRLQHSVGLQTWSIQQGPMNCLGNRTWHPEDEEELVIVLPDHLFAPVESPVKGVRGKHVPNLKITAPIQVTNRMEPTIADTSLKNLADDSRDVFKDLATGEHSAQGSCSELGATDTPFRPSSFDQKIEKAQGKDASTLRQWERGARHYETRRPLDQGGRPRCCGETTSLRGG